MRSGRSALPQRTSTAAVLTLITAVALIAGCGQSNEYVDNAAPADPGEPVYGGSIIVGVEGETNSWLPSQGTFAPSGLNVGTALYDSLVRRAHDGSLQPYLAESITPNDDFSEWTLRLRPDVRFHDGTPLDAEALKWNFDNLHKVPGSVTFGAVRDIDRVEIVDEMAVRYHLTKGMVAFPDLLIAAVGWPVSPTSVQAHGLDAGSHPVGTGPFKLVDWRRDDRIIVERNDDYWQEGLPYLDRITFRPLPDEDTRLASLVSRDLDAIITLRQGVVDQLRRTGNIYRYEFLGNNGSTVVFNTQQPPLDDVRVRRGLAHALDREPIIDVLGGVHISPPQSQYFSRESPWYSEQVEANWPKWDLEAAKRLLGDYINDPERSDGLAPEAPIALEYLCPPDPALIEASQIIQAFWRAAGAEVRLRQVEQATLIQSAMSGNFRAMCFRNGTQQDPYMQLSNGFGPIESNPTNITNFVHPVIDEQLEVLRTSDDIEVRREAAEAIMMLLSEELPLLWLGSTRAAVGARQALRNLDGWVLPDGTPGEGIPQAWVMWSQVWLVPDET